MKRPERPRPGAARRLKETFCQGPIPKGSADPAMGSPDAR